MNYLRSCSDVRTAASGKSSTFPTSGCGEPPLFCRVGSEIGPPVLLGVYQYCWNNGSREMDKGLGASTGRQRPVGRCSPRRACACRIPSDRPSACQSVREVCGQSLGIARPSFGLVKGRDQRPSCPDVSLHALARVEPVLPRPQ